MTDSSFSELLKKISNTRSLDKRIHGGKNALKRYNKEKILDFSVCVNPFGPPAIVLSTLNKIKIDEYPDPDCSELKLVISDLHQVPTESIIISNGSAEMISLLFFCFVREGDKIAALWPSFEEYKYYCEVTKSKFVPIILVDPDFDLDVNYVIKIINQEKPKLFFLCNPVNPTGQYFKQELIEAILKNLPEETFLVLDEAYVNFVRDKWNAVPLLEEFKNLIILRSLTKDYALTNLRLGYGLAHSQVIAYLNSAITCWSVNGLAQYAGIKALQDQDFLVRTMDLMHSEKKIIEKELINLGYTFIQSATNYYLLQVKDSHQATELLLKDNIYVRDCSSYGLPVYIRISIGTPEKNSYLLATLKKLVKEIKI